LLCQPFPAANRLAAASVLCLTVSLCLDATAAFARQTQATGADLVGIVLDSSEAVIAGATIAVINQETGLARSVQSGADGRFAVRALPVGTYRAEAQIPGFDTLRISDIVLTLGASVSITLTMKVAGIAFDVDVIAERSLSDPQQPGVGRVVERIELERLPVNVRNYLAFSLTTPAAASDRTPQQGASRTSGLSFAGQRARSNNIVVDGFDNNDETVGSVRAVFSQDAVQEFQVLAHGYSAEFGKASGGVVNIVTRSGTNTPRGSAFLFVRDDALSSRNYFDRAGDEAPYEHRQLGGTFGGPLRRDRAFLFGSVERLTIDASNFVTIDDTNQVPHPFQPGATLGTPAGILRQAGFEVETGHVPYAVRSTQWLVRLDHYLNQEQRIAARINGASELNENVEPFGGLTARSRAAAIDNSDFMIGLSHHLVSGTRFVNEARLLIARRNQDVRALDPLCTGPCDREDEGGPTLEVGGVANVGRQRFTPTPRDNVRYQFADTISQTRGKHLIKAGADFSFIDGRRQALPLHFGGRYIFASLPPIPNVSPAPLSSIAAVAFGLPVAYVQGYGFSGAAYDAGDLALFAEDVWQVRPTFALRYGVRYQRQFWPDAQYEASGVGEPYPFPADLNNVAPRVAATWAPGPRKPVIRAGYGIYYDNIITATAGITQYVSGREDGVRTLVLPAPAAWSAWRAPDRRLSEEAAKQFVGGSYPSVTIPVDPGLETGYAHHTFAGIEHRFPRIGVLSANVVHARGFKQLGSIDYNPVVPSLGAGRRPADVNGVAGTSTSVLQYTSWGETWYRALTVSLDSKVWRRGTVRVAYTLSKAEDTATDFQSSFLPQDNGRGRDPARPDGLPLGFEPRTEHGPALHDRRHKLVVSAVVEAPGRVVLSALVHAGSGWPYNILAGQDLNGDRDGGSSPSDRARTNPSDAATSLPRNAGRFPAQASVDARVSKAFRIRAIQLEALFEVFNVFNRTNFIDVQNVFGTGAYPLQPAATFGQFTQADAPRQVQLAVRVSF
jgi:Carboxypeptidase regulatory-like domain